MPRWRAKVVMRDGTASLRATVFSAFESVAELAGETTGQDHTTPADWQSQEVRTKAMSYISALPLTVRITLNADSWSMTMQATVQVIHKTFSSGLVSHPLKVPLHLTPTEGAWPPVELAASSYDAGLGLSVVSNIAVFSFRALLKMRDAAIDAEAPQGTRDVSCAFADDTRYHVELRDDDVGMRLRALGQDSYIQAVVAWDSDDCLIVHAFVLAPEPFDLFKAFFKQEITLQDAAIQEGPSFAIALGDTPCRILAAAQLADMTSPPVWKHRRLNPAGDAPP